MAATGTGKTVMFADLTRQALRHADRTRKGVLLLVHRDELVRQIVKSCGRSGVYCGVEKGQERARNSFGMPRLVAGTSMWAVCASVQTLRGKRLEEWPRDSFSLIIIDEAHHATADSYRNILEHFDTARRVGFTATADRLDGAKLGQVFESLAYEYNLRDAITDGWLVKPKFLTIKTDPPLNLRDLRVTGGDFNLGDLENEIQSNIGTLVNAIHDTNALEDRRTIAFTPSIGSAAALAAALGDVGISAKAVAGNSPDRTQIFEAHQRGDFQVLVNCMLATEGYDDPAISCILLCRPTKSRALYSQMIGRGTRLHPESGKTDCKVVDFAFLSNKLKPVVPVELFDNAELPEEVLTRAASIMEEEQDREWGLEEAIEAAGLQIDEERRVRIKRQAVAVQAKSFDPIFASEMLGIELQKAGYEWTNHEPASERQVNALIKWGIEATPDIGKGTAGKMLTQLNARKDHGWCSPKQMAELIASGMDPQVARGTRSEEAKAIINAGPPSPKQVKFLKWKNLWTEGLTKAKASLLIGQYHEQAKAGEG